MNEQKWITHTQAANKAFHANQPGIAVVHYVSALNTAQRLIQLAQVNGAKQAVGMLLMSSAQPLIQGLRYKSLYERMICHMSFLRRRLLRQAYLVIPLIQQSLICEWI